jgi:DNA polymerase elongation subunit (family B)
MLERLVSVYPDWDSSNVFLFQRDRKGRLIESVDTYRPFILTNSSKPNLENPENHFNTLLRFESPREMSKAHDEEHYPWINPVTQYLMMTGNRFFANMDFSEVRRAQVLDDRIMTHEGEVSSHVRDAIYETDPDVIEIFDIEKSVLHLKDAGRKRERIYLSPRLFPDVFDQRLHRARLSIPGRQTVELFLAAYRLNEEQHIFRDLRLKTILSYFGLEDDIKSISELSNVICRPDFELAKRFPLSYEAVARTGNASMINYALMADYLKEGYSIPKRALYIETLGGRVELFKRGVARVSKVDVKAMYPNIMLGEEITPRRDYRKAFPALLKKTLDDRLDIKRQRDRSEGAAYTINDLVQSRLKVIANTFYGYMFTPHYPYGDSIQAAKLTERGREIITDIEALLRGQGLELFSLDTDGIFFSGDINIEDVQSSLPPYLKLELEGPWTALFIENKNYILLDDEITVKGSLKSRGYPLLITRFIRENARLYLEDRAGELREVFNKEMDRIASRDVGAEDVMITKEIKHSLRYYLSASKPSAHMELAVRAGKRQGDFISYFVSGKNPFLPLYQMAAPIEDYSKKKLNTRYYMNLLDDVTKRAFGDLRQLSLFN